MDVMKRWEAEVVPELKKMSLQLCSFKERDQVKTTTEEENSYEESLGEESLGEESLGEESLGEESLGEESLGEESLTKGAISIDEETAAEEEVPAEEKGAGNPTLTMEVFTNDASEGSPQSSKTEYGWLQGDVTGFKVRGPRYFEDKAKVDGIASMMTLVGVDFISHQNEEPLSHLATYTHNFVKNVCESELMQLGELAPYFFIIHMQVPGSPQYTVALYFAQPVGIIGKSRRQRVLEEFINSDQEGQKAAQIRPRP